METHLLGQEAWPPPLLTSGSTLLPAHRFCGKPDRHCRAEPQSPEPPNTHEPAAAAEQPTASLRIRNHHTTSEPETAGEGSTSASAIPPTSG